MTQLGSLALPFYISLPSTPCVSLIADTCNVVLFLDIETHVVQDITVDGAELLTIVYELQWTSFGQPAKAEFIGFNNEDKMRFTTGIDNLNTSSAAFATGLGPHCASPSSSLYPAPFASSTWSNPNTCSVPRSEDSSLFSYEHGGKQSVSPLSPVVPDMGPAAFMYSSPALFS